MSETSHEMKPRMSPRWSQFLVIASAVLLVGTLAAQWAPPMLEVAPAIQVTCAAPLWDAEAVFSGQSRSHDFVIENTGRTAVTVKAVTASCGCTTFSQELAGKRVEAGQSLIIPVIWNVHAASGKQHKEVAVHFEEWPEWSLPLKIEGDVKPSYTITPPQLSFGTISPDAELVQEARIVFAEGAPVSRITSVQCSHRRLQVTLEETENPREQSIVVRTVPPLNPGRLTASLHLQTDADPLVLQVVAAVEADPAEAKSP